MTFTKAQFRHDCWCRGGADARNLFNIPTIWQIVVSRRRKENQSTRGPPEEAFYRTRHWIRGAREREMMMMWCRRGEKTVETFPKRRRRDKQRQQLCVLLFGMQETFLLHEAAWKRRTHRPNYCQQPKPRSSAFPPSFSNQSINLFFPACRSRHVPAARVLFNYHRQSVWRDFPFLCKSSFHGILSLFICIMNAATVASEWRSLHKK
jgi:hypothetical protein